MSYEESTVFFIQQWHTYSRGDGRKESLNASERGFSGESFLPRSSTISFLCPNPCPHVADGDIIHLPDGGGGGGGGNYGVRGGGRAALVAAAAMEPAVVSFAHSCIKNSYVAAAAAAASGIPNAGEAFKSP